MKESITKKRELASTTTSEYILRSLLSELDHDVREGIARNTNSPSYILKRLFILECERSIYSNDIQYYIIMNPKCPKEDVVRFYMEFINNMGKDGADKFIKELDKMIDKFYLLLDDPDLPFTTLRDLTNLRYLPYGSSIVFKKGMDTAKKEFYGKEELLVMRAKAKIRKVVEENNRNTIPDEEHSEMRL